MNEILNLKLGKQKGMKKTNMRRRSRKIKKVYYQRIKPLGKWAGLN